VPKLGPLTTPMRAPGTPLTARIKTDPGARGAASDVDGTTPDSSDGSK